jgi:hypothetical protein
MSRPPAYLLGLLGWVLLSGCVVEAPETIEELVVFGFEHFDERPAYLEATVEGLLPLIVDVQEELEAGYGVDLLAAEHLEAAGIDRPETEGIVGAMGGIDYCHALAPVLDVITDEHKDQLFESVQSYAVRSDGDRGCFLAGECDRLAQDIDEVADASLLGTSTRTYSSAFRWIELEDGSRVVVQRTLGPGGVQLSTDFLTIHQQYALVVLFQDGETARRLETFWADTDLGELEVPELFVVQQAVRAMGAQADRICDLLDQ